MKKYRLAVIISHPIQYQTPLFREIDSHPRIDLMVYFCAKIYVTETFEHDMGIAFKWDIPLLKGYKHKFLHSLSPKPLSCFIGLINPSIIKELFLSRYDAIWIHGYANLSYWLAFLGAWISRTPILLRGESHLLNYRPVWKRFIKQIALKQLFRGIACFLPIGTLNAEYYKHYGISDDKMFLTPYSVDNDFFSKKYEELYDKRDNLKEKLSVSPKTPIILYASKMIQRKRAMDLLRAYEKIQEKVDAALVYVGNGIEKPSLEKYTKDKNLRNVYFVGFKNQTELPEYFIIADVFVLPSTDEPWGLVINEAMNFGLPIITTDQVGAAHDLIKNGENGFIYQVGDIKRLADCLLRILQDSEVRERMRKHSLETINKWSFKEDIEGILASLKYVGKR